MKVFNVLEISVSQLALGLFSCLNNHALNAFLLQHQTGNWGHVTPYQKWKNQMAVREGGEVVSRFSVANTFLVIKSHLRAGFASSVITVETGIAADWRLS